MDFYVPHVLPLAFKQSLRILQGGPVKEAELHVPHIGVHVCYRSLTSDPTSVSPLHGLAQLRLNAFHELPKCTDEELRRLIAVSAHRSVVYLTAAHTGLRRKELRTLVWADVFLDSPNPHIVVQAKNAKNRKLQPLPLHPEVVAALKKLDEERRPRPTDRVFYGMLPKRETFRHDLKRAGIQNIEDPSGKLHFHSLRHTMNHRLQENGVVPTVAQHLMRHSTVSLTTKTYISSASLPLAEAIKRVPAIVLDIKTDTPIDTPDTPIDTLEPVAPCHSVSQVDAGPQNAHDQKTLINRGSGHDLTLSVANSHNTENGRGDRIRTCDLVVPNHALYQAKLRPEPGKAGTPRDLKQPK